MATHIDQPKNAKQQTATPAGQGSESIQTPLTADYALGGAPAIQRARQSATHLQSSEILYLQRAIGNRAVGNLLQRHTSDELPSEQSIGAQGGEIDGTTFQAIQRAKGGGTAVPKQIVSDMQSHIGADVSHARIHTGQQADVLNRKMNAEAFTHGRDVFFSKDAYKPGTSSGKQLLAHELTHVAQQTRGNSSRIQPQLRVGPAHDHFERQADRIARSMASPRTHAPHKLNVTGRAVVQRRLKFKPEDLDGEVSKRGKRVGRFGFETTFAKIKRYLTGYWAIAGKDAQSLQLQVSLLTKMRAQIDEWNVKSQNKKNFDVNDGIKSFSLNKLKQEIDLELPKVQDKLSSVTFMQDYGFMSEKSSNYHILAAQDEDLAIGKQMQHLEKHGKSLPDSLMIPDGKGGEKGTFAPKSQWGKQHDRYKSEKHLGLRPADRAAIGMYTGDQFIWMNPAMAGNEDWFQGTMNKELGDKDSRTNDKQWRQEAMEENQKVGNQLVKTMGKLPNWKQNKTIYRGESITDAEAQGFQVGSVKEFPFFVSTSQELTTPKGMMQKFISDARPWGVLYYIKSSKTGKNVAPWSANAGEAEILFAPGTKFTVTKVRMRDDTKKRIDLEVTQS